MIKINPSILSKTVKAITPKTEKVEEAQIRGTIVYRNQEHFVQLDGAPSNALTPIAEFAEGASDAGFVHGDRVLVLIKNHQAIVTKNLTTGLQAQAAKEASAFTTAITDEGITAQRIIANDTFTNTLRANHITADEIIAGMATIDTLDANYAHITDGVIDNAKIGVADVNDLSANYAHITTGVIDNAKIDVADVDNLSANYAHITNGVIDNAKIGVADVNNLSANYAHIDNGVIDNAKIGYADVNNLSANYAQINAANVTDLSAQNAWVNKIMVQTGLLAHEGTVFTLDAIQVNAANITAGTIDVNRLIVTVDGEKYLVEIDPTTHQPSYEKLDGGIVEPRTITADKIVAHDITVQEITTENLVGTNGWINLNQGKFLYTTNGSTWANTTNGIMWDGTNLKIKGDVNITAGNVYTKTQTDTALGGKVGNNEVITKINASSEGVQIQAAKVDIAGAAVFNNYSTTTQMNTAIGNAVDGIEVGGRNLWAYGSDCQNSLDGLNNYQNGFSITTEDGFKCAHATGALNTTKYLQSKIWYTPRPSETFTYSCFVKIKNIVRGTTNPACEFNFSGQTIDGSWKGLSSYRVYIDGQYAGTYPGAFDKLISDQKWHHFAIVGTYSDAAFTAELRPSVFFRDCTGDLYVRNLKAERGTKATDWSSAPEDVQAEIDAKKSIHTFTAYSGQTATEPYALTYEQLLYYSQDGRANLSASISPSDSVKIGDTVRLAYAVSDMNNALVYIVGEVTGVTVGSPRYLVHYTAHGLDTTIIDGGNILTNSIGANQIKANSIITSKLAVKDLTDYVQLNEYTASSYGFTKIDDSSNPSTPWFQMNPLVRDRYVSDWYDCQGGESFRVSMAVSSNVQGSVTSGGTTVTYLKVGMLINYQNAAGTNNWAIWNPVTSSAAATESYNTTVLKIGDDAVRFRVGVHIEGYNNGVAFSGTLKVRKFSCFKMANANLIVDGSITSDHISANKISANKIKVDEINIGAAQITRGTIDIGRVPAGALNSNINIGGRNLFRCFDCLEKTYQVINENTAYTYDASSGTYTIKQTANASNFIQIYTLNGVSKLNVSQILGKEVTLSAKKITPSRSAADPRVYFHGTKSGGGSWTANISKTMLTNTFTVPTDLTQIGYILRLDQNTAGSANETVIFEGVKLELGNKATDWSPAPEDVQTDGNLTNNLQAGKYGGGNVNVGTWANVTISGNTYSVTGNPSDLVGFRAYGMSGSYVTFSYETNLTSTTNYYTFKDANLNIVQAQANVTVTPINGVVKYTLAIPSGAKVIDIGFGKYPYTAAYYISNPRIALGYDDEAADCITKIDNAGIRIHPSSTENNSVVINASGMEVYKGGASVAFYGDTARVGKSATRHIEIKDGGMQVYQDSSNVMAHIGYGSGNAQSGTATAPYFTFGTRWTDNGVGNYSVVEGQGRAIGFCSHAEGWNSTAQGTNSHAEGVATQSVGYASHAGGSGTIANGDSQTAIGKYNKADTTNVFIIGGGSGTNSRSNALTVGYDGTVAIGNAATTFKEVEYSFDTEVSAGGFVNYTDPISEGVDYYPLAISGWNASTRFFCLTRCHLTNKAKGSASIDWMIYNPSSSKRTGSMTIYVTWVKVTY